jgi:hypothetical protein
MTQQYVVGELSLLLAELQSVAGDADISARIAQLRRDAERRTPWGLADIETRALAMADCMCWCSLSAGNLVSFERQAAIGSQMLELGVSAGLLPADLVAVSRPPSERGRPS